MARRHGAFGFGDVTAKSMCNQEIRDEGDKKKRAPGPSQVPFLPFSWPSCPLAVRGTVPSTNNTRSRSNLVHGDGKLHLLTPTTMTYPPADVKDDVAFFLLFSRSDLILFGAVAYHAS